MFFFLHHTVYCAILRRNYLTQRKKNRNKYSQKYNSYHLLDIPIQIDSKNTYYNETLKSFESAYFL